MVQVPGGAGVGFDALCENTLVAHSVPTAPSLLDACGCRMMDLHPFSLGN